MKDAKVIEEQMKLLVFTSPIGLNSKDLTIEMPFNKNLKVLEFLKNFRLEF
jgi:hypothetical protein